MPAFFSWKPRACQLEEEREEIRKTESGAERKREKRGGGGGGGGEANQGREENMDEIWVD